ncbi:3-alpha-hydroxysteroid sulfotransferase-like [Ruditapes philippinarum]|uniref:3-alpha-hydroxysteroid sulfotransferase-like n=1 Tax=Ruditapes philippinarum TaxID=129788 RepID=UPI00295B8288|nr:3-alpha-hydroxysteroid sulfotransferase-like [Ruditapes philippinarum]
MDLLNSSGSSGPSDILVTGYKYSAVDHLHRTLVQLCTCALPVTPENTIPNITFCEGLLPSEYPHLNISQSTKIVYVVRNPKDIAGTLYRNSDDYDDTYLSDYLIRFINGLPDGNWCQHTRDWSTFLSQHPTSNLHLIYFDDLVTDFEQEISKLCQFLNIDKNYVKICTVCMSVRKESEQPEQKRRKLHHTENDHDYNEIFFEAGKWKGLFTVKLAEEMDNIMLDELKDTNLDFQKLLRPYL